MTDHRMAELLAENASLKARLAALEIRSTAAIGLLTIDVDAWRFTWKGQVVTLTVSEGEILRLLTRHPGRLFNRDQLMQVSHGWDGAVFDRTIDSMIKRLRRKFRATDPDFDMIETAYGLGYRWRVE